MRPGEPPGLQAERTFLAWQRTGLGVLGTAALLAHAGPSVAWMVALVLGVALLGTAERRLRRVTAGVEGGAVDPARGPALGLVLGLLVVAALATATVLRG
ncbi:DUF202 domain-containing protein [Nocardioides marmoribigeumensis]|uniref:Uncharacterized membrane protein YidH (DUF202 family) n=1 Tax=Nocardioides marmoribigeumensis TaxID=433649 RepID=A0ABU2BYF9_9ACTN|nr:DUF202 domain-containing protein [Nocardioides marmoribigeumensis]MDR7363435.1 uncharacterized membrane protein YidH (DUF202 family) [Nocardioides marmoribigeumensis]